MFFVTFKAIKICVYICTGNTAKSTHFLYIFTFHTWRTACFTDYYRYLKVLFHRAFTLTTLNLRKMAELVVKVQQLIANRHLEPSVTYLVN